MADKGIGGKAKFSYLGPHLDLTDHTGDAGNVSLPREGHRKPQPSCLIKEVEYVQSFLIRKIHKVDDGPKWIYLIIVSQVSAVT